MERTWATREQLILEAVADAQEHGRDVVSAARAAVPDLPGDLYVETLASLEYDGSWRWQPSETVPADSTVLMSSASPPKAGAK
jgi:hypothetical protein